MSDGSGAALPRVLVAFIAGQIGLHSAMAGVRLAAPLQALRDGHSALAVGVLMALFAAAPVMLALPAGRLADRHGYHRPIGIAVGLTVFGLLLALAATAFGKNTSFLLLGAAAVFVGAGANIGLISIQRSAGRSATSSVERVRVFSWLGLAPALSNVVGSVSAGVLIDLSGFRAAFVFLLLLPLVTLLCARRVPREAPAAAAPDKRRTAWDLWRTPHLWRLMMVNWLLSTCWDVHTFAVPILGHERGFAASTIGLVLGVFPLAVATVRLAIPLLAHRMEEVTVLRLAMVGTALVFVVYPLAASPWLMGGCAIVLGITLGAVQPMIMSTLHQLTPEHRHGEALALRSMTMNASGTVMPLLFGVAGSVVGVGGLFWLVGAAVGAGNWVARGLAVAFRT
jgi:MFS family permease